MCIEVVTCGPNEAMIISGVFHSPPTFINGGRAFVIPCVQLVQKLSLATMTLLIESKRVYTAQGVPISVTGVAQVKVNGANEEMLRNAAEQFGGRNMEEIHHVARETLEGHQRAIMGSMTVEEIYKDRKTFSQRVFEVASTDLMGMGLIVISYTLKDLNDEEGYLKSLGMARTAEVKRDALIGKATAQMETMIRQSLAAEQLTKSKLDNDTQVAHAKRDFDVKKSQYDTEVNTAKAEAELAYQLQAAILQQRIKEETMHASVVERQKQIEIAEFEIQRREKELDYVVRKPAEAEKYRLEKMAEAYKKRVIMEAEAEAEAIAIKGEAEAFAIEAKAKAEAEQMAKKADAWAEYKEAALVEMILQVMPKLAAEIAGPLSQANKITMVSDGTGEIGASRITAEVLAIMQTIPGIVTSMTGVDFLKKAGGTTQ